MNFHKIKVWAKIVLYALILISVVLVIFSNRDNRTDLWLFHGFQQVAVLWIILVTAIVTIVAYWIFGGVLKTLQELKQLRELKNNKENQT